MDHICIFNPIIAGKEAQARTFYEQVEGARRSDYEESERRLGITRELAWITPLNPGGEAFILYIEAPDFAQAFSRFVESREPFDSWFKEELLQLSGLDLNDPPQGMQLPELVSCYVAAEQPAA